MSSGPRKPSEEVTHPSPSKRSIDEVGVLQHNPGKSPQPFISQSNFFAEPFVDGRSTKVPRTELRDAEKRPSPISIYRVSSSANGSSDHLISSESKDSIAGDLNADTRAGCSVSKTEGEPRQEIKGEIKFVRTERDAHLEFKNEKEGASWREKEIYRSKRHSEAAVDGLEEARKEVFEAHEVLVDERVRDRERKRKDEKHREGGEREKDRSERRSSLKYTSNSSKDFTREDRENERWDRERRDSLKDKEKRDRREAMNMNEKEEVEGPAKTQDQEGASSDSKRTNDLDITKNGDRDVRERKRERYPDSEADRNEKRRHHDKDSDDGLIEAVNEREREVFGYGVQQRRRMLRPRATHSSTREPRFRARARENDGSQGKSESSVITYRVGECMQELIKSWKEYEASQDGRPVEGVQSGPTLEIRIPAEHVTATNRQVRGGQLWGTDVYTDDSDLVAVLMHTGYCRPTASLPPPAIQELRTTIRVLPPQICYHSTLRNNVRSRAWGAGIGCSYRVEKCVILKRGGGTLELEPCLALISAVEPTLAPVSVERTMTTRSAASNALRQQRFVKEVTVQYNLCNEPWVKYSINFVADKGLKKPLYTSARLKKGEVIYVETHFKRYELCYIGEKSTSPATEPDHDKPPHGNQNGGSGDKNAVDLFRWSLCKKPLPQEVMRSIGIPLPLEHLEVLEEGLEWEAVQWSQTGVWVAGKEYPLARVHFLPPS